jgi:cobalt-zinc-cadmium efflux system outer membrane protein
VTPAAAAIPAAANPHTFTADVAVRFALEHNPQLLALREQRGVARAGVVIARTYPYNPLLQSLVLGANGPAVAGVTNHVFNEHTLRLDLEVRGQGKHRKNAAEAVATRTEWEIANQEMATSIAAARAFNTVLYRKRKLEVLEETVKFSEQVVEQVQKLVNLGRIRSADLVVASTELDAARAQQGQGRTALAMAKADLCRQLGTLDMSFDVKGDLDLPVPMLKFEDYTDAASQARPDLQARRVSVAEAQARLRLQVADRFGNPSLGPGMEYNETSATFVGLWMITPVPVINTRKGEILQAQAVVNRALADVRQLEVQAAQDVQAALARLTEARGWVESYTANVLPNLTQAVKDMNKLLAQNDPGVDVLRVIGVQRNYLRALDAHLDALFEVSQARADLAAAVADPALAVGMCASEAKPGVLMPMPKDTAPGPQPGKLEFEIPSVQP